MSPQLTAVLVEHRRREREKWLAGTAVNALDDHEQPSATQAQPGTDRAEWKTA